jgi:WD40 repeat protein
MNSSRISLATKLRAIVWLLSLTLIGLAMPQDQPGIVWQAQAGPAVAFSADGQYLLAGTQLRQAADGVLVRTFPLSYFGSGINAVALSKDGQYAALGIQGFNQNLNLFNAQTGAVIQRRITAHNNGTTALSFSPDSQLLASGGADGTGKLWHLPDMTLLRTLNGGVGYRARIFAVAFSNDGQLLALGGQAGVLIFNVADGSLVQALSPVVSTRSLASSPDGQILAAGSNAIDQYGQCTDCTIKMWRWSDGALLNTIASGNNGIIALAFAPDQQVIAAGSGERIYDGTVHLWRIADGTLLKSYDQTGSYVTSVAFSPDGSLLSFARVDELTVMAQNPFAACPSSLAPPNQFFSASGGDGLLSVSVPDGCGWTATSNVSWITITSNRSVSGSGNITIEVSPNTTGSPRDGTVTIAGKTFTAVQDGGIGDNCADAVSPTSQSFVAAGGNGSINVEASNRCAWHATSNAAWVTITSGNGMGNGSVAYTVAANPNGSGRSATITVSKYRIAIKQKAGK